MLAIPDPSTWKCRVWEYTKGHSILQILVQRDASDTAYFITFEGVEYFEGRMWWDGAAIEIGSPTECLKLFEQISLYPDLPKDYLLERIRLYKIVPVNAESGVTSIRLLAVSASVIQTSLRDLLGSS